MRNEKPWTSIELEIVKNNVEELSNSEIAALLPGRTRQSVKSVCKRYNFKRSPEALYKRRTSHLIGLDLAGENNPNWKGGIATNNYHYKKLQVDRYPERVLARKLAAEALKKGLIKWEPCQYCKSENSQMHHDDYSKSYDVRWLCKHCHDVWHILHPNGQGLDCELIQIFNPKLRRYFRINNTTKIILSVKKDNKPYKYIPIKEGNLDEYKFSNSSV